MLIPTPAAVARKKEFCLNPQNGPFPLKNPSHFALETPRLRISAAWLTAGNS